MSNARPSTYTTKITVDDDEQIDQLRKAANLAARRQCDVDLLAGVRKSARSRSARSDRKLTLEAITLAHGFTEYRPELWNDDAVIFALEWFELEYERLISL